MRLQRSLPGPLPVWHATQPRAVKIGNTVFANETFVGAGVGAPSVTFAFASVTLPAATGEVAMSTVIVAAALCPASVIPTAHSNHTARPDAVLIVAPTAALPCASRKNGPIVEPASRSCAPGTPARGAPFASTSFTITMPFAAV